MFVGRADPAPPRVRHRGAPRTHHQTGFPGWCGGPPWRPSSALPPRRRSPWTAPGSSHAAARTSPRSPRRANCSPWSTTGCATGTSAPWLPAERREHPGRNTRAAAALSDPLPGVVAHLIDPACCYRTAPCPHQLGEGMTGSRTQSGPAPTYLRITLGEGPTPNTISPLIFRHPPTACTGPAQRQDRSSSLRCGRSVLTPALTQCCLPGGRKPAKPQAGNPVDTARPFRDDSARHLAVAVSQVLAANMLARPMRAAT